MRKYLLLIFVWICCSAQAGVGIDAPGSIQKRDTAGVARDTSDVQLKTFERNFKQKYKSSEFDYNPKPAETTAWDRFKAWLGRIIESLFRVGGGPALSIAGLVLRVLAVVLVVLVIFFIVKAIMNKEGQWIFGKGSAKRILSADEIERNIQAADFEKLIAETISAGNQRLAVRYYYLWLLQLFSKRGIIEWDIEKTNSDYLYEIKHENDRKEFAYLSYLYNNIWYGEFELAPSDFDKAAAAFDKTLKRVR